MQTHSRDSMQTVLSHDTVHKATHVNCDRSRYDMRSQVKAIEEEGSTEGDSSSDEDMVGHEDMVLHTLALVSRHMKPSV